VTDNPTFLEGDLVDITFRRAVIRKVNRSGTLAIIHSDEQLDHFDPTAADVEVTKVGREPECPECEGVGPASCRSCCGTGRVFR
jgi:hypothetical protein